MQGKLPYFMAPPRGEGETEDDGDDEEVEDEQGRDDDGDDEEDEDEQGRDDDGEDDEDDDEQGRDDDGDDDEVTVTSTHFGNVLVLRVGLGAT